MYRNSIRSQETLSKEHGVLVDVRTPIFGDTSIDDLLRMGHDIVAANDLRRVFWTWRLYKPVEGLDWPVAEKDKTIAMMVDVSRQLPGLWMGMCAKWEKGGMLYVRDGKIVTASTDTEDEVVSEFGSGNKLAA